MFSYAAIEVRGGWPRCRPAASFRPGDSGADVATLRRRLAITEDLAPQAARGDVYDEVLADAVKRFQARHGLPEAGAVGPQTLAELNVPDPRACASSRRRSPARRRAFPVRPALRRRQNSGRLCGSGERWPGRPPLRRGGRQARPAVDEVTGLITAVNLNPT